MESKNLRNWNVVKQNNYKLNGVTNPENWMWERVDGVFIPVEELPEKVVDEVYNQMLEELDPDWTVEEMEEHGWNVVGELVYGDECEINYRENCGHTVLN